MSRCLLCPWCARCVRDGGNVDEALALSLIEDLRADVVTRLTRNADERAKQVREGREGGAASASGPDSASVCLLHGAPVLAWQLFTEAQAAAGADPEKVSPFSAKLNAATK